MMVNRLAWIALVFADRFGVCRSEYAFGVAFGGVKVKHTREDSNLQPSVPKTDALSSCATDAF